MSPLLTRTEFLRSLQLKLLNPGLESMTSNDEKEPDDRCIDRSIDRLEERNTPIDLACKKIVDLVVVLVVVDLQTGLLSLLPHSFLLLRTGFQV